MLPDIFRNELMRASLGEGGVNVSYVTYATYVSYVIYIRYISYISCIRLIRCLSITWRALASGRASGRRVAARGLRFGA